MNLAADIVLFLSMDHLSPPLECQPRILRKDALSTWYSRVLVPFKCLAQISSEKGALAVDGNKYIIGQCAERERETLEPTVLNGMTPSIPFPQNSGSYAEEEVEKF